MKQNYQWGLLLISMKISSNYFWCNFDVDIQSFQVSVKICDASNGKVGEKATSLVLPCLLNFAVESSVSEVRAIWWVELVIVIKTVPSPVHKLLYVKEVEKNVNTFSDCWDISHTIIICIFQLIWHKSFWRITHFWNAIYTMILMCLNRWGLKKISIYLRYHYKRKALTREKKNTKGNYPLIYIYCVLQNGNIKLVEVYLCSLQWLT